MKGRSRRKGPNRGARLVLSRPPDRQHSSPNANPRITADAGTLQNWSDIESTGAINAGQFSYSVVTAGGLGGTQQIQNVRIRGLKVSWIASAVSRSGTSGQIPTFWDIGLYVAKPIDKTVTALQILNPADRRLMDEEIWIRRQSHAAVFSTNRPGVTFATAPNFRTGRLSVASVTLKANESLILVVGCPSVFPGGAVLNNGDAGLGFAWRAEWLQDPLY